MNHKMFVVNALLPASIHRQKMEKPTPTNSCRIAKTPHHLFVSFLAPSLARRLREDPPMNALPGESPYLVGFLPELNGAVARLTRVAESIGRVPAFSFLRTGRRRFVQMSPSTPAKSHICERGKVPLEDGDSSTHLADGGNESPLTQGERPISPFAKHQSPNGIKQRGFPRPHRPRPLRPGDIRSTCCVACEC